MQDEINLRAFQPSDSAAVIQLIADSPDTGMITFKPVYKASLGDVFSVRRDNWEAVIADVGGRVVGFVAVAFDVIQLQEEARPAAYLFSLVVHPEYRRKGIASRIVDWQLNRAREKMGKDVVIYAFIQQGNTGSLRAARHWSNQFIGDIHNLPVKMLNHAPAPNRSLTIRPAQVNEFEQIADKLNEFYAPYNFYTPETGDTLRPWRDHRLLEEAVHEYWIALNPQNEIVAGIGIENESIYTETCVERMPAFLRVLNKLLKIVPSDGVMRNIDVEKAWYAPGQQDAARYLWRVMRYEYRHIGTAFLVTYDSRSSLKEIFAAFGWSPKAHAVVATYAPFTIGPDRLIYALL
jgi:GNAT superfamily N-acetyltransferase